MKKTTQQIYRDSKKLLGLFNERAPDGGFDGALRRLFGDQPKQMARTSIGGDDFLYAGSSKDLIALLPSSWKEAFDQTEQKWPGCEKWWAGYPLIAIIEIKSGDDGMKGHLKLNAEVGPISVHEIRQAAIGAIKAAATEEKLDRIHFQSDATEKGRLYSRFLRKNTLAVGDIRRADDIESKLKTLVGEFKPEFELITSVLRQG